MSVSLKKPCAKHREALAKWAVFGPDNPCTRYGLTGKQVREQVKLIHEMCREERGCEEL